jgi:orotidine-5'-phosphate decarboxylase
MIVDKLFDAVATRGPVCVGLDTSLDYLPPAFRSGFDMPGEALFQFNRRIVDATAGACACFKLQIAYYEALGLEGLCTYAKTLQYIRGKGCIAIADVKRGDIAATAQMYARAHFEGEFEADYMTLSPYMGMDSIEPYMPYLLHHEKGVFVLIRTSNPGATDIQYLEQKSGARVYTEVGRRVAELGQQCIGSSGYSSVGGVVGCTHVEEAQALRHDLSSVFFLVPGYGAQGGTATDVAMYLKGGNGGVVNSSRGILLAWKNKQDGAVHFDAYARAEAERMRDDIAAAVKALHT